MFQEVSNIIQEVFLEAAHGIMNEAASNMEVAEWKSNGNLEIKENGFIVSWDNLLLIFREFGTGRYSASYLSNKPQDIKDEAMKFFVNGLGTVLPLPGSPTFVFSSSNASLVATSSAYATVLEPPG